MKLVTAGGVVVALAAVFGAVEVSKARTVETDNAHVDGNLLALAAKVDGELVDLTRPFTADAQLALVTAKAFKRPLGT